MASNKSVDLDFPYTVVTVKEFQKKIKSNKTPESFDEFITGKTQQEVIDAIEESKGFSKKEPKLPNLVFKNKLFDFTTEEDITSYNELINSVTKGKYLLYQEKDNWDKDGGYYKWVCYAINTEFKENDKEKKEDTVNE